ncbi:MAG: hypothetical protein V4563_14160 [Pseudomonadota bacterium]
MNALEYYLMTSGMNDTAAMNKLQDAGVISDNCVHVSEVAYSDCEKAVAYLKKREVGK